MSRLLAQGAAGYVFISGSMERHEFRFAKILDWIRQHVKPVGVMNDR